jgi:eukaryotic-like serine/threonine-protein kinase
VLYELLAGEVPFDGDNFVAVAMRHVNDPVPSVGEVRPDVPLRLDWAIQRAMAKDHGERFESMADFAAELEACYAELDGDEGATMVVPAPAARRERPKRKPRRRGRRVWPAVLLGVALAAVAGGVIGALTLGGGGNGLSGSPPRPAGPVHFVSAAAYDPLGDGQEHDEDVRNAIDSDPTTFWETEHYQSFDKQGVGLALEAARPVSPRRLTVTTDTPGFTAEIKAGDSPSTATTVAGPRTMSDTTSFDLSGGGRYFVIWITDLGPNDQVHVNDASAR